MTWSDDAKAAIERAHAAMPADISLPDRVRAVDAAYPFGARANFPYKAWLKERRAYLCRYGFRPRNTAPESPLERMMRRAGA